VKGEQKRSGKPRERGGGTGKREERAREEEREGTREGERRERVLETADERAPMPKPIQIGVHPRANSIWLLYNEGDKLRQRLMPVRDLQQLGAERAARALVQKHREYTKGISFAQLQKLCAELENRQHTPQETNREMPKPSAVPGSASRELPSIPTPLSRDLPHECAGGLGSSPGSGFGSEMEGEELKPQASSKPTSLSSMGRPAVPASSAASFVRNISYEASPQEEEDALCAFAAPSPAKRVVVDDALSAFAAGTISASSAAKACAAESLPKSKSGSSKLDAGSDDAIDMRPVTDTPISRGAVGFGRGNSNDNEAQSASQPQKSSANHQNKDAADDILDILSDFSASDSESDEDPVRSAAERVAADASAAIAGQPNATPSVQPSKGFLDGMSSEEEEEEDAWVPGLTSQIQSRAARGDDESNIVTESAVEAANLDDEDDWDSD